MDCLPLVEACPIDARSEGTRFLNLKTLKPMPASSLERLVGGCSETPLRPRPPGIF